jgi:hypothetical protein
MEDSKFVECQHLGIRVSSLCSTISFALDTLAQVQGYGGATTGRG